MKSCVFPGSFDPISSGHLNIIIRASKVFDKVYVLVSFNSSKNYIFDTIERVELVKKCVKNLDNVEVSTFDGTVVEFARKVNSKVIFCLPRI